MVAHGTRRRGEAINTAKLSEDDVKEIRKRHLSQGVNGLAREYGVCPSTISRIVNRKSWAVLLNSTDLLDGPNNHRARDEP